MQDAGHLQPKPLPGAADVAVHRPNAGPTSPSNYYLVVDEQLQAAGEESSLHCLPPWILHSAGEQAPF